MLKELGIPADFVFSAGKAFPPAEELVLPVDAEGYDVCEEKLAEEPNPAPVSIGFVTSA